MPDATPAPHGTYAGAQRHAKEGTPTCDACKEARAAYMRAYRDRNEDQYDRGRWLNAARARALTRLAHAHPEEFDRLMAEEVRKA